MKKSGGLAFVRNLAVAAWALVVCGGFADAAPLFEDDTLLDITLAGPMTDLLGDDGDERSQWPFKLTAAGHELDVKLKLRGHFRRANCSFAPIRLNFQKGAVKGTPFEGQNKLKLVTHCKSQRSYELNTLEEYNAYRIFNLITDASFRVRLLRVNYIEAEIKPEKQQGARASRKFKPLTRYGFVIEDVQAMAKRLGGKHYEPLRIDRDELDAAYATRVAIFEYMIANTDFSLVAALTGEPCCHNAKLIQREGAKLLAVPYDFDMSGLVNAPYATPNPQFRLRSVRERKYWGFCADERTTQDAVADFVKIRDAVVSGFAETAGIDAKEADRAIAYIDGFYKVLSKDNGKRFLSQCRD